MRAYMWIYTNYRPFSNAYMRPCLKFLIFVETLGQACQIKGAPGWSNPIWRGAYVVDQQDLRFLFHDPNLNFR